VDEYAGAFTQVSVCSDQFVAADRTWIPEAEFQIE